MLPKFASIKEIWVICDFVYFECMSLETLCFSNTYQAYKVQKLSSAPCQIICAYENLVDYNVFHIHKDCIKELYITVKYDIKDLMAQHLEGSNPLKS